MIPNEYAEVLRQAALQKDYTGMTTVLMMREPVFPSPAILRCVNGVTQMRAVYPDFVPVPNQPDPAAPAILDLRRLLPPQVGLLLCTVPAGKGMLRAADGTRYTFWTESQYTMVIAANHAVSGLLVMPAGEHMFTIGVYGAYDPYHNERDPLFSPPIQHIYGMIQVQPGTVTEVVPERRNNFAQLAYQIVYH
ncbi:MAG TPA: hypothetical protein DCP68_05845 [Ruminococcus sp.]|nr:hypothetical protein [Ruminococcus sp.]